MSEHACTYTNTTQCKSPNLGPPSNGQPSISGSVTELLLEGVFPTTDLEFAALSLKSILCVVHSGKTEEMSWPSFLILSHV